MNKIEEGKKECKAGGRVGRPTPRSRVNSNLQQVPLISPPSPPSVPPSPTPASPSPGPVPPSRSASNLSSASRASQARPVRDQTSSNSTSRARKTSDTAGKNKTVRRHSNNLASDFRLFISSFCLRLKLRSGKFVHCWGSMVMQSVIRTDQRLICGAAMSCSGRQLQFPGEARSLGTLYVYV